MSTHTPTSNRTQTGLLARFRSVRAATLDFTAPLSPEDMMVQSCPEASPVKWHLAHTSWFFETFVLTPYAPGYKPFHPDFHWLFNSYYNSLGDMPAKNLRASFSRPPLDAILAFRSHVDNAVAQLLEDDLGESEDEILRRIALGLEHEQQHLELAATDVKHALFTNPLHPAYAENPGAPSLATASSSIRVGSEAPQPITFTRFPGGLVEIGVSPDPSDPISLRLRQRNPAPPGLPPALPVSQPPRHRRRISRLHRRQRILAPRALALRGLGHHARRNRRPSLAGPALLASRLQDHRGWSVFTLHGFLPVEALIDTPVCHLSFFEADAFARWSGCRLPTEFEWETAALAATGTQANMLESNSLHPTPSLSFRSAAEESASHPVLQQMFGDVWEWTASPYTGYPGYKPLPGALGEYNGKFMSSQIILRGGSCVTPATHIRPTYRNFFGPSTRWQFLRPPPRQRRLTTPPPKRAKER